MRIISFSLWGSPGFNKTRAVHSSNHHLTHPAQNGHKVILRRYLTYWPALKVGARGQPTPVLFRHCYDNGFLGIRHDYQRVFVDCDAITLRWNKFRIKRRITCKPQEAQIIFHMEINTNYLQFKSEILIKKKI